jgi:hypothetical protein
VTVNLGAGTPEQSFTANLQQQGERLTGSIQGSLGSGQIASGSVSGNEVRFTVPITLPAPASQTTDAQFTGTISGNTMSGAVQVVGRDPGTFTATRAAAPQAPGGAPPRAGQPASQPGATPPPAASEGGEGNLSGKWTASSEFGGRQVTSTLTLSQQGNRLTGRIESPLGTLEISDGSVSGGSFRFNTTADIGGQTFILTYEGTMNGDSMSGTVTTPRGSIPFTGTRNP